MNLNPEPEQKVTNKSSKFGLSVFCALAGATAGLCAVTSSFIFPAFRKVCLPFVPATTAQVENVMKVLYQPCRHGMTLVDIGSGDGRIVLKAASYGFHATGYELNIWLVLYSKFMASKSALSHRARFRRMDLWKADYSLFDNVVIFGVEEMMPQLEKKLMNEMKEGSKIIACRFPLPNTPITSSCGDGVDSVWSYTVSSSVNSDKR